MLPCSIVRHRAMLQKCRCGCSVGGTLLQSVVMNGTPSIRAFSPPDTASVQAAPAPSVPGNDSTGQPEIDVDLLRLNHLARLVTGLESHTRAGPRSLSTAENREQQETPRSQAKARAHAPWIFLGVR